MKIKNFILTLFIVCALLFSFTTKSQAQAFNIQPNNQQTVAYPWLGAGMTNLLAGYARVTQYIFSVTNAVPGLIYIYDSPGTNNTYVTGAYSNITYTVGPYTNIYTNFVLSGTVATYGTNTPVGIITTNVYTAIQATTNSIAANTNSYNLIATFVVPASTNGGLYTINFSGNIARLGLLMSNTVPISGTTIQYAGIGN